MNKKTFNLKFAFFIFTIMIFAGSIFTVSYQDNSKIKSYNILFNVNDSYQSYDTVPNHLNHKVKLYDTVSISSEKDTLSNNNIQTAEYERTLVLNDQIIVESSESSNDVILFAESKNIMAQLDRIFERKKIEIHSIKIVQLDILSISEPVNDLFDYLSKQSIDLLLFGDTIYQSEKISSTNHDAATYLLVQQQNTNVLWQDSKIQSNYIILLIPLVATVLINSEHSKFNKQTAKKSLSCVFIIILLSTAVSTPISISSSYYGMAFAETPATNSTLPELSTNSTLPELSTNSTLPELS
ncbi:MAG: hypothetical protein AABZ36_07435, partial [Nitrospirota bacterium]